MAEQHRLEQDRTREANWRRWGPWLPERQWGTVREDYSADGSAWSHFPHDHARSRAFRWGEDGILGITDRECRLCLAPAMWNGKDPILKERLFGLSGDEGNHGEDAKELWWHLEPTTPTASYARGSYRYPMREFPYAELVQRNRQLSRLEPEFELEDTGIFDDDRFWNVEVELAKAAPDDLIWRITVTNHSSTDETLHLLPKLWFRNSWIWGCQHEGCGMKPRIQLSPDGSLALWHETLLNWVVVCDQQPSEWLFTDNHTNNERLYGAPNATAYVKDAIDRRVVHGEVSAVNPAHRGTIAAAWFKLTVAAGASTQITFRLAPAATNGALPVVGEADSIIALRRREAEEFYADIIPSSVDPEAARVARLAFAGLIWSHKFYMYIVRDWLEGDPEQPTPPPSRLGGRNAEWSHLYNMDVVSMPDPFEYPWYASWDLAFHMVVLARIDPSGAKRQLELFLKEWYMHPNGQIPAYEWSFSDTNPPTICWAVWRVYRLDGDLDFLERCFHKLLLNFCWWTNRKDEHGKNLFAGGFLGLDNIGPFDRSRPPPPGWSLEQADGTAWMAFFAGRMLTIALELARHRPVYEHLASKFLEHMISITHACNTAGGTGLWSSDDEFYCDHLRSPLGSSVSVGVKSLVGVVPLFASTIISKSALDSLPGFSKRLKWFRKYRPDLAEQITEGADGRLLIAIPTKERLIKVLKKLVNPNEFLSPFGVRSFSKEHETRPFVLRVGEEELRVDYAPGDSNTHLFGGNSNWRGPVWFPLNYLLIEALERYQDFYGDSIQLETATCGTVSLGQFGAELSRRLGSLFLPAHSTGRRPCMHSDESSLFHRPAWRHLVFFHEFFHGENGRGLGAMHQTGWTALVALSLCNFSARSSKPAGSQRDHAEEAAVL